MSKMISILHAVESKNDDYDFLYMMLLAVNKAWMDISYDYPVNKYFLQRPSIDLNSPVPVEEQLYADFSAFRAEDRGAYLAFLNNAENDPPPPPNEVPLDVFFASLTYATLLDTLEEQLFDNNAPKKRKYISSEAAGFFKRWLITSQFDFYIKEIREIKVITVKPTFEASYDITAPNEYTRALSTFWDNWLGNRFWLGPLNVVKKSSLSSPSTSRQERYFGSDLIHYKGKIATASSLMEKWDEINPSLLSVRRSYEIKPSDGPPLLQVISSSFFEVFQQSHFRVFKKGTKAEIANALVPFFDTRFVPKITKKDNYEKDIKDAIRSIAHLFEKKLFPNMNALSSPSSTLVASEPQKSPAPVVSGPLSPPRKEYHSKDQYYFWIVASKKRVERDEYESLSQEAKSRGGFWSKFEKGFRFDPKDRSKSESVLAEALRRATDFQNEGNRILAGGKSHSSPSLPAYTPPTLDLSAILERASKWVYAKEKVASDIKAAYDRFARVRILLQDKGAKTKEEAVAILSLDPPSAGLSNYLIATFDGLSFAQAQSLVEEAAKNPLPNDLALFENLPWYKDSLPYLQGVSSSPTTLDDLKGILTAKRLDSEVSTWLLPALSAGGQLPPTFDESPSAKAVSTAFASLWTEEGAAIPAFQKGAWQTFLPKNLALFWRSLLFNQLRTQGKMAALPEKGKIPGLFNAAQTQLQENLERIAQNAPPSKDSKVFESSKEAAFSPPPSEPSRPIPAATEGEATRKPPFQGLPSSDEERIAFYKKQWPNEVQAVKDSIYDNLLLLTAYKDLVRGAVPPPTPEEKAFLPELSRHVLLFFLKIAFNIRAETAKIPLGQGRASLLAFSRIKSKEIQPLREFLEIALGSPTFQSRWGAYTSNVIYKLSELADIHQESLAAPFEEVCKMYSVEPSQFFSILSESLFPNRCMGDLERQQETLVDLLGIAALGWRERSRIERRFLEETTLLLWPFFPDPALLEGAELFADGSHLSPDALKENPEAMALYKNLESLLTLGGIVARGTAFSTLEDKNKVKIALALDQLIRRYASRPWRSNPSTQNALTDAILDFLVSKRGFNFLQPHEQERAKKQAQAIFGFAKDKPGYK